MTKERREALKEEAKKMNKEELKSLCFNLFELTNSKNVAKYEMTFRELNSIWCIFDTEYTDRYDEEY